VLLSPAAAALGANVAVSLGALATLILSQRLRRGYIAELAACLRSGTVVLDESGVQDQTTRLTLSQTLTDLNRERLLLEINALRARSQAGASSNPLVPTSAAESERSRRMLDATSDLLSGEPVRLRRALAEPDPALTSLIIPLLGREDVGAAAMKVLSGFGKEVVGQLADALLNAERQSSSVRRRLVRVIATAQSAWAAAALAAALEDPDFDVRRQVVRGLEEIAASGVDVPITKPAALAAVLRELGATPDVAVSDRVEHALRLLGLVFDRDAFRLARGALDSPDLKLRGTALEYLDNVLPVAIKSALFGLLPAPGAPKSARVTQELIDELRRSGLFV
jgi:ATP:ADP antiporter, AAA family